MLTNRRVPRRRRPWGECWASTTRHSRWQCQGASHAINGGKSLSSRGLQRIRRKLNDQRWRGDTEGYARLGCYAIPSSCALCIRGRTRLRTAAEGANQLQRLREFSRREAGVQGATARPRAIHFDKVVPKLELQLSENDGYCFSRLDQNPSAGSTKLIRLLIAAITERACARCELHNSSARLLRVASSTGGRNACRIRRRLILLPFQGKARTFDELVAAKVDEHCPAALLLRVTSWYNR